jgi:ankyrin repeat protein
MAATICSAPNHEELVQKATNKEPLSTFAKQAVVEGCLHAIELAIQNGESPNVPIDQFKNRMIHWAAKHGNIEIIKLLVKLRPDELEIDAISNSEFTALHCAAFYGHEDVVELLIQLGSQSLDTPEFNGRSCMHLAATNGHANVIKLLYRLGSRAIDMNNHKCNRTQTPMHTAAYYGHPHIIRLLLELGSNSLYAITDSNYTTLHSAMESDNIETVIMLIEYGLKLDALAVNKLMPMHLATNRNKQCYETVEQLLLHGSKAATIPDNDGYTPLYYAATHYNRDVFELLLKFNNKLLDSDINKIFTFFNNHYCCITNLSRKQAVVTTIVSITGDYSKLDEYKRSDLASLRVDEETVLETRYRVYFATSLTFLLLFTSS